MRCPAVPQCTAYLFTGALHIYIRLQHFVLLGACFVWIKAKPAIINKYELFMIIIFLGDDVVATG